MKFTQINEGIIKLPEGLYSGIRSYVSSMVCTAMNHKIRSIEFEDQRQSRFGLERDEEKDSNTQADIKALRETINSIQSKYSAKILSNQSYNNIFDHIINIPFDAQKAFDELPKNLQQENVLEHLKAVKLQLLMTDKPRGNGYAGLSDKTTDYNVHLIEIAFYTDRKSAQDWVRYAEDVMVTLYHEMQHFYQYEVIDLVDKSKKQLQRKDGYNNHDDDYYASAVEFTTQVGDIGHLVVNNLIAMKKKDTLSGNRNQDIKAAIETVMKDTHAYKKTVSALRNYKEDDKANKAMKIIYSMAASAYNDLDKVPPASIEFDDTEHDFESESSALKVWEKKINTKGFKAEVYGSGYDTPGTKIKYGDRNSSVSIQLLDDGMYKVNLDLNGDTDDFTIDRKLTDEMVSMIVPNYDPDLSAELMDWLRSYTKTADMDGLYYMLEQFAAFANFFSENVEYTYGNKELEFTKSGVTAIFSSESYYFLVGIGNKKFDFTRVYDVEMFMQSILNASDYNPEQLANAVSHIENYDSFIKDLDAIRSKKYEMKSFKNDDYDPDDY